MLLAVGCESFHGLTCIAVIPHLVEGQDSDGAEVGRFALSIDHT